jgi:hypothetical protein
MIMIKNIKKDPNEAAVVITEAIISRDLNEKNLLLQAFKQSINFRFCLIN